MNTALPLLLLLATLPVSLARTAPAGSSMRFVLNSAQDSASIFQNATFLRHSGYTHAVAGSAQIYPSYAWLNASIFPAGSPADQWRQQQVQAFNTSLLQLKAAGLQVGLQLASSKGEKTLNSSPRLSVNN